MVGENLDSWFVTKMRNQKSHTSLRGFGSAELLSQMLSRWLAKRLNSWCRWRLSTERRAASGDSRAIGLHFSTGHPLERPSALLESSRPIRNSASNSLVTTH